VDSIDQRLRLSRLARLAARRTRAASLSARATTRAERLVSRSIVEASRGVRAQVRTDDLIARSREAARRHVAAAATPTSPAERYERFAAGAKIRRA
jgi:hypothetical protein